MTMEFVPDGSQQQPYWLVAFDKDGKERRDDPDAAAFGGVLSWRMAKELEEQPYTDVFLLSHGWMGDMPEAKTQCAAWISAMLARTDDRAQARQLRPGFKPLLIGLHWPSLPWGNEQMSSASVSFAPGDDSLEPLVSKAADSTADSEEARQALRTIFAAAMEDAGRNGLTAEAAAAYMTLRREAGLADGGAGAAPGADSDGFDPASICKEAAAQENGMVSFGLGSWLTSTVLSPLRVLSFWKMKDRARHFGESGAASLLRNLQAAAGGRDVRFHLMGHSFGCIVVSAAAAGASNPVHAMLLAQGAMSLWSCCASIPAAQGHAGYFRSLVAGSKISGPILTTMSMHDTANRVFYPQGARMNGQVSFAPGQLPTYGAIGCFGLQGLGSLATDMDLLPANGRYNFQGGRIYNLEASRIICNGGGVRGAHNDIVHPEVAHAFWEAATTA